MKKLPITVLIPTLNAEFHLNELFDSVLDYVEEVQILDSRSIDKTVDLALARGVTVVQKEFTTHGDHFQWMISNMPVRTEWIFLMAQDERFTPSLLHDLRCIFEKKSISVNAFTVRWRLWFMGKPLNVIIDNIRLMRVGFFRISDVICNEQIIVDGSIDNLRGILEHKDTLCLHDWYEKQNLYSTMEAIAKVKGRGEFSVSPKLSGNKLERRMFFKKIFFKIPFRYQLLFLYNYFLKGAWRNGKTGFIWARLRSEVYRMREYKYIEMMRSGYIPNMPKGRHGDYDERIMETEIQQRLLPDVVNQWKIDKNRNNNFDHNKYK